MLSLLMRYTLKQYVLLRDWGLLKPLRYDANEGVLGPLCCLIDSICVLCDAPSMLSLLETRVLRARTLLSFVVCTCACLY